ncbi:uncharacterized protein TRAVEDRAFT_49512 [Trametes versicolor FP-101664 SS1]|uniref:uncharacterized protein n=1 Tax=Trametes versicolor (strain FP-101664) TaxID=717944 RepID=UPI000462133A|nr:uncharacterized protein TRAVEDRAFT_49512 [Trametes versicolor FP-101664 SS1]EIW56692.1 hypothetical protein TRAVEDRAFT_49512 [Trametes versicolor FP-101664 SS1]
MQQLQLSSAISSQDSLLTIPAEQRHLEFDIVSATLKGLMPKWWMECPMTARNEIHVGGRGPYVLSFRGVPLEGFLAAQEPAPCCGFCANYEIDMYKITETIRPVATDAKDIAPNRMAVDKDMCMDTRVTSMLLHMMSMMDSGGAHVDVDTAIATMPPPSDLTKALQDLVLRCTLLSPELRGCRTRGHGFHVAIVVKLRAGARPAGATDDELVRAVQAAFPDLDEFRRYMGSDEPLCKKTFQFSITLVPGGLDDAGSTRPIKIGPPPAVYSGDGAPCALRQSGNRGSPWVPTGSSLSPTSTRG